MSCDADDMEIGKIVRESVKCAMPRREWYRRIDGTTTGLARTLSELVATPYPSSMLRRSRSSDTLRV